jgi:hypothetical protein
VQKKHPVHSSPYVLDTTKYSNINLFNFVLICTGHTQTNGAALIVIPIETAPFFCVCPVLHAVHGRRLIAEARNLHKT